MIFGKQFINLILTLSIAVSSVTTSISNTNNSSIYNTNNSIYNTNNSIYNTNNSSSISNSIIYNNESNGSASTNIISNSKESIIDNYKVKWGYNSLSDEFKPIYESIYDGMLNGLDNVNLSEFDVRTYEIEQIFWACDFDNPQFLNIADNFEYSGLGTNIFSVTIKYERNMVQTKEILNEVRTHLNNIINEAIKLSNDYERVKFFHDWIINNTKYVKNDTTYISEIDGPVIYGKALCEGYSKTFEYLCQSVGIPCICIRGKANDGNHMWNMVQLENNWYHVDVTWDDPITTSGKQICRYTYFLLSDSQIKKTHIINNYFKVPNALNNYQ